MGGHILKIDGFVTCRYRLLFRLDKLDIIKGVFGNHKKGIFLHYKNKFLTRNKKGDGIIGRRA